MLGGVKKVALAPETRRPASAGGSALRRRSPSVFAAVVLPTHFSVSDFLGPLQEKEKEKEMVELPLTSPQRECGAATVARPYAPPGQRRLPRFRRRNRSTTQFYSKWN
mmetsp:Transcript_5059/g.16313  ORF Transcript_5059/g.16313 Transcript_5059/m.16313 type:complete len:108 (-) Transcript_5059:94-417(-)